MPDDDAPDAPAPDPDAPPVEALPQQEPQFRAPARFGHVPVAATPLGWDPRNPGFRNHYPIVSLPTQIVERVPLGAPELEPNRLLWGDNLHVMRQLPSESVDLVYIDPPFFSNRVYNVIWGDEQEKRSFDDIWEGGLDGYLIWLNARLYEMKRLLKPTGSIYVHCDWHASHYIKVEMDKIFGFDNYRNQIIWKRHSSHADNTSYGRVIDHILFYSAGTINHGDIRVPLDPEYIKTWFRNEDHRGKYNAQSLTGAGASDGESGKPWRGFSPSDYGRHWSVPKRGSYADYIEQNFIPNYRSLRSIHEQLDALEEAGLIHRPKTGVGVYFKQYLDASDGQPPPDLWTDIAPLGLRSKERVGYPTQKPEALLERIIKASSNENDVVLDIFVGGGTTPVVAQRLGRRWIAMDQSRVAVSVTAERLKHAAAERGLEDAPVPDFTVEHWGVYEAGRLSELEAAEFRAFVLACYDARVPSAEAGIHGYKGSRARIPVWVGPPSPRAIVTADDVNGFARAIAALERYRGDEGLRDGVMLAWGFGPDARAAAGELREREGLEIAFVRLEQVAIDSPAFRSHVASKSTERGDYRGFLTFVHPPVVEIAARRLRPLRYAFDAGDTQVLNAGAKVVNAHWDFDYDGRVFRAARGEWFRRGKGKDPAPVMDAQHVFPRAGRYRVACRVQDDKGGEGMAEIELDAE